MILDNVHTLKRKIKILRISYIFIAIIAIYTIFRTHPLLHFGYDMWYHLDRIDSIIKDAPSPFKRYTWYGPWAAIFKFFDVNDVLIRASVIHYTQILISVTCIYISTNIILNRIFKNELGNSEKLKLKIIAIIATILWITIHATESQGLHHVWLFWYSINYQITLPLYLLNTALSLNYILNKNSIKNKKMTISLILVLSMYILLTHEMEFLYYLIALLVIIFLNVDSLKKKITKKYFFWGLIFTGLSIMFAKYIYMGETPAIIKYANRGFYSEINQKINDYGIQNIQGLNRASASINELIILSFILLIPVYIFSLKNYTLMNTRVVSLIVILSSFSLLPLFKLSAGILSLLTHATLVNRFYYASLIYFSIPIFFIIISITIFKKINTLFVCLGIILTIIFVDVESKLFDGNYHKNIKSIKSSFNRDKMNIGFDFNTISKVRLILENYDAKYGKNGYCLIARQDYAYLIYFTMNKKNILFDKHHIYTPEELKQHAQNLKIVPIVFDTNNLPSLNIYTDSFPNWFK